MFVPLTHGARVVISFSTADAEEWSNVLHFTKTNYTTQDLQDLIDDILTSANATIAPAMSTNTGLSSVTGYDIRSSGGVVLTAAGVPASGQDAAELLPINLAIVMTLRSATRGRSGRGRVYIAGFTEAKQVGGNWSAATVTAAGDYISGIEAAANANGWAFVIMSKQQDGVALNPAVARTVTSYEVRNTEVGTQRRRVDRP